MTDSLPPVALRDLATAPPPQPPIVTTGTAPARLALAAQLGVTAGVARQLPRGYVMGIEADAATYFYRAAEAGSSSLHARAAFVLAARLLIGKQW